ncbi:MAG: preprotein translocase subunit SecE [Caldilineaceae bacterium]
MAAGRAGQSYLANDGRRGGIRLTGIVVAATIVSGIALFGIDYLLGSLIGVLISAMASHIYGG